MLYAPSVLHAFGMQPLKRVDCVNVYIPKAVAGYSQLVRPGNGSVFVQEMDVALFRKWEWF